jgi:hypothetical protein
MVTCCSQDDDCISNATHFNETILAKSLSQASHRTMIRATFAALVIASAAAFSGVARSAARGTRLSAEQEIKDLNLDQMFEVFEAADSKVSKTEIPKGMVFEAKFDAKSQAGASAPFGFFDPLAQSTDVTEAEFKKYRESELKHGRVAMLAVLGVFFGETGLNFFGSEITGPAIYQFQQADGVLNAFTYNILGLCAAVEGYNIVNGWQAPSETFQTESGVAGLKDTYVNGDLKFDPLGLKPKSADALKTMQTKEINNGRLAMIAIAGIVAQELVTGNAIF